MGERGFSAKPLLGGFALVISTLFVTSGAAHAGPSPILFSGECLATSPRATIAAVGDILLHSDLQRQAYKSGHETLWSEVQPLLTDQADVAYGNLEGPTAPGITPSGRATTDPGKTLDNRVYTGTKMNFNFHPSILPALLELGVDVISTANNHALDRQAVGVDLTIDQILQTDLNYSGTRKSGSSLDGPWATYTEVNGIKIGWIACAEMTNGIPDRKSQVNLCWGNKKRIKHSIEVMKSGVADFVIVTPHWGDEYQLSPDSRQVELAHELLDAGADAIIGSHPHVLQSWEKHTTPDGRETFVAYSLGNFVSGQHSMGLANATSMVAYLGIARGSSGQVALTGVGYVPLYMGRNASGSLAIRPVAPEAKPVDFRYGSAARYWDHLIDVLGTGVAKGNLLDAKSGSRFDLAPGC